MLYRVLTVTRFRKGDKLEVVDPIFTNRDDMIEDISTVASLGKSDHFALVINLSCTYAAPPR